MSTRRHAISERTLLASLCIFLVGCGSHNVGAGNDTVRVVSPAAITLERSPIPPAANAEAVAAKSSAGEGIVTRIDPKTMTTAAMTVPAIGALPTRKDFVDPPLPAELMNDGGLVPLPPLARSTDR